MLDGPDATPERLRDTLNALLADPNRRATLARNAATHGKPDAADQVVTEILTAAAGVS